MKETIRRLIKGAGAVAVGFAKAGDVDSDVAEAYERWIGEGFHGEMDYLRRHIPLKKNTGSVLENARTVISIAFSFAPEEWRDETLPYVSAYAYGRDYHKVIRKRLKPVVSELFKKYGGVWRICIDSAPVAEKYWAMKSGIAKRSLNGCVIINNCGSLCFLSEILTTLAIPPDPPSVGSCLGCGICIDRCPAKALRGDGTMDAAKCINYLTIEKKSPLTAEELSLLETATPGGIRYGCDICLKVCPHNHDLAPTCITEFHPTKDSAL